MPVLNIRGSLIIFWPSVSSLFIIEISLVGFKLQARPPVLLMIDGIALVLLVNC